MKFTFKVTLLILMIIISSCVPSQPGKKATGACQYYEIFDPVTRSCKDNRSVMPPTNTLKSVKMFEDTPMNVILTYEDLGGDYATACNVSSLAFGLTQYGSCSCTGGFCTAYLIPDTNFSGISEFTYYLKDKDGYSTPSLVRVEVAAVDDPPVLTTIYPNPVTLVEEESVTIQLGYTDAESDKAVSCVVDLTSNDYASISYPCTCDTNGQCIFVLTGKENKTVTNATYTYKVKSSTGLWSENQVVGVYTITNKNDLPEVSSTTLASSVVEPIDLLGVLNIAPWTANVTVNYKEGDDEKPTDCTVVNNVGVDFVSCNCGVAPTSGVGTCDLILDMSAGAHHDNSVTTAFTYQIQLQDLATGSWTTSSTLTLAVDQGNDSPSTSEGTLVTGSPHLGYKNQTLTIDSSIAFKIDEGGSTDEDSQYILIKPTSADTSIIKSENIAIYWNGVKAASAGGGWYNLGDGSLSSDTYPITFVITPETDQTTAATNITLEIKDSEGGIGADVTFSVEIQNVKDAPSINKKTTTTVFYDKYHDAPNCDDSNTPSIKEDCTRNMAPSFGYANIKPNKKGQIFYDHFAKVSYVSTDVIDSTNWTHFITDCPFSPSTAEPGCLQYVSDTDQYLNCIGSGEPTVTPTVSGSYYYDYTNDKCYKSSASGSSYAWALYTLYSETSYCNYNSSGTTAPSTTITESTINDVYKDTASSTCYYAKWTDGNPGSGTWTSFTSYCNYTKRDATNKLGCRYYKCTDGSGAPSANTITSSSMDGVLYRDSSNNQCYRAIWDPNTSSGSWVTYSGACTGDSGQCRYYNCIGSDAPRKNSVDVDNIYPSAIGDYYFDAVEGICYKSYGTDRGEWAITGDRFSDLVGNETQPLEIKNIRIDEGDGSSEDADAVSVSFEFLSNDTGSTDPEKGIGNNNLFIPAQVKAYCNGVEIPYNSVDYKSVSFLMEGVDPSCDLSTNSSFKNFEFRLNPIAGDQGHGRSEIKMTISDSNTATTTDRFFTAKVYPIGANHNNWDQITSVGNKKDIFGNIMEKGYIKIKWNDFSLSTDMEDIHTPPLDETISDYKSLVSITGYNVYRRTPDEDHYNFDYPVNKTIISTNVREFTDMVGNSSSLVGPAQMGSVGSVYYYTVRGVDSLNGKIINAPDPKINEIRVIAPPDNMVFVHRSMANKRICEDMQKTPDGENHFRCTYSGMGELPGSTKSAQTYYDVSTDYLIDRFEAGCPFSFDSTYDIHVGTAETSALIPSNFDGTDNIYYSRRNGKCFDNTGVAWTEMDDLNIGLNLSISNADKTRLANLPPLVNISQGNANSICELRNTSSIKVGKITTSSTGTARLPSRKEQMFYSEWPKSLNGTTLTDTVLGGYEQGLTLSSTKVCNSSSANGLNGFSNEEIPNSGDYYSLPGTLDSNIKSLVTGSSYTTNCSSIFGVQDSIGNVKEWMSDRIYCPVPFYCQGVYDAHPLSTTMNGTFKGLYCNYTIKDEIASLNIPTNNCGVDSQVAADDHGHCIGDGSPLAAEENITPAIEGIIYYDASSDDCYVSAGATPADWTKITEFCPVTHKDVETSCSGYSAAGLYCVGTTDPANTAVREGSFYYRFDAGNENCFRSNSDGTWTEYNNADVLPPALNSNYDMRTVDYGMHYYELNGRQGPCDSGSSSCVDPLTSWEFEEKSFGAIYMSYPVGLPVVSAFKTLFSDRNSYKDLRNYGSSGSGYINTRDDLFSVNAETIYNEDANKCGALSTGGGYSSGIKAGRYTAEFYPCNSSNSTHKDVDIGFRCVIPIPESFY